MKIKLLYEELADEFKKKLARELTSQEYNFLQWVSEQHQKENEYR